eukprot:6646668-Pyramimonas_sp.AAC.1
MTFCVKPFGQNACMHVGSEGGGRARGGKEVRGGAGGREEEVRGGAWSRDMEGRTDKGHTTLSAGANALIPETSGPVLTRN